MTSHRLPGLVGRQSETDRLLTVVTGSGASRTLVLTGDPGIGKSALMDQAAATADLRGCAVLRSQGRPGEQLLEFGVLRDLLRPVLSRRAQLGAPHREVLDALVSDGPQSSPFTIAIAVLELLEVGDDDEWVVLLVDDFQWIDSASAFGALTTRGSAQSSPPERLPLRASSCCLGSSCIHSHRMKRTACWPSRVRK